MKSMDKFVKRFRKLPTPYLYGHVASKFLFGLGLGIVIASYLACSKVGFWIIVLSIVLAIPSTYTILSGKIFK